MVGFCASNGFGLVSFLCGMIAAPWRQRALAVADRISSAQSSGVKVKAMEEESTGRRGD